MTFVKKQGFCTMESECCRLVKLVILKNGQKKF